MAAMTRKSQNNTPDEAGEISRRDFLSIAWVATGALTLAATGIMGLHFFAPRIVEGAFGGTFDLGSADSFPLGSVTPVPNGRFYVVRQSDGGFVALYQKCTHLGCAVPWEPRVGQFVCPCHASAFELDGTVLNPPAPRPLDRFPVQIVDGSLIVDTGERIERDTTQESDLVYPEGGVS